MKAEGPKHERETILRWDEEDATAGVWTASAPVYRKLLKRLGKKYLIEDGERHAVFEFPVRFITFPRVKQAKVLTPHQQEVRAKNMKKLHEKKKEVENQ
jgi:hypothetical protein